MKINLPQGFRSGKLLQRMELIENSLRAKPITKPITRKLISVLQNYRIIGFELIPISPPPLKKTKTKTDKKIKD